MDANILDTKISELKLSEIKSLDIKMNIHGALLVMQRDNIGSVAITDKGLMVGILTERDIVMKVAGISDDYKKTLVSEIMTPSPSCVLLDDEVGKVISLLVDGGFRHVPIIDSGNRPISMISVKDVMKFVKEKCL